MAYVHAIFMQHWSKLEHPVGDPCPVGRVGHGAVCLGYGEPLPQVLVTGGLDDVGKVLSDAWILDVQSGHWREVIVQMRDGAWQCKNVPQHTYASYKFRLLCDVCKEMEGTS